MILVLSFAKIPFSLISIIIKMVVGRVEKVTKK